MSHGVGPGALARRKEERTCPQPPGIDDMWQRWGECRGCRGLVPEIRAADVSEPGAAQAAGLHEVLGSEHHGPHPGLWHGLLGIQGLGH